MKDRLTVLLGLLLSAALLYGLIAPRPQPAVIESRPTSADAGRSGELAARRWLEREGVPTYSLRERFGVLRRTSRVKTRTDNLMIMVMPQLRHVRTEEVTQLRRWVAAGNTLLVLAALNDTPEWSYRGDEEYMHDDLEAITGVTFAVKEQQRSGHGRQGAPVERSARLEEPEIHVIDVDRSHWLTAGVGKLRARSDLPTDAWEITGSSEESLFEIGAAADDGRGALWLLAHGRGQILLSGYGSLFQNDAIGEAGNRRFLANLVRFHLGRGGAVIFDDMHQGLSALYDPEAFFGDARLHRSILLVLALWLAFAMLGGDRLGAVRDAPPSRPQADFVRRVGHLLARKVRPADAARRMFANFFAETDVGGAPDAPQWQDLVRNPLLDAGNVERLRAHFEALQRGRRMNLTALHNELARARRALH